MSLYSPEIRLALSAEGRASVSSELSAASRKSSPTDQLAAPRLLQLPVVVVRRTPMASIRHACYSERLVFQPKVSERFWCGLRGLCHARSLVGGVIRISRIVELLEHDERSKAELEKRIVELKTTAGLV